MTPHHTTPHHQLKLISIPKPVTRYATSETVEPDRMNIIVAGFQPLLNTLVGLIFVVAASHCGTSWLRGHKGMETMSSERSLEEAIKETTNTNDLGQTLTKLPKSKIRDVCEVVVVGDIRYTLMYQH